MRDVHARGVGPPNVRQLLAEAVEEEEEAEAEIEKKHNSQGCWICRNIF